MAIYKNTFFQENKKTVLLAIYILAKKIFYVKLISDPFCIYCKNFNWKNLFLVLYMLYFIICLSTKIHIYEFYKGKTLYLHHIIFSFYLISGYFLVKLIVLIWNWPLPLELKSNLPIVFLSFLTYVRFYSKRLKAIVFS